MKVTLKPEKVSIISTNITNIDLELNTIIDQGKLEEKIYNKEQLIKVFDRLEDKVELIKVIELKKKHWIYNDDRTFNRIIHVI